MALPIKTVPPLYGEEALAFIEAADKALLAPKVDFSKERDSMLSILVKAGLCHS
jgi:hypothetical protein